MEPSTEGQIPIITNPCEIRTKAVCLPTIPDATQAQTVLLIEALECSRALIVNLSDVCDPDSGKLDQCIEELNDNKPRWDSIFCDQRRAELTDLMREGRCKYAIGGWGALSSKQKCLREAAQKVMEIIGNQIVGAPLKSSYKNLGFRHPRPTARGGPKWRYYANWRACMANVLGLCSEVQTALQVKRSVDLLVDKDHIWQRGNDGQLEINLGAAADNDSLAVTKRGDRLGACNHPNRLIT